MTALVAHRGDTEGFRENTLAALRSAMERGADLVELDVRLTADGEVVVLHDPTLERLWGDPRPVTALTLAEVRGIGGGASRIPTLAEALALSDELGVRLLIDMDAPDPAAAAVAVVRAAGMAQRVCWCGDTDGMRVVRAAEPQAEIWLAWPQTDAPSAADLAELRPAVVNVQHLVASQRLADAVHTLGARLSCWTVNDPDQIAWLRGIGVDSITTDRMSVFEAAAAGPAAGLDPAEVQLRRAALVARELARHAIELTTTQPIVEVATKANPADHVTALDTSIESRVRAVVAAQFPEHDFVGEEFGGSATGRPCWYLDPVDGTANLANGVPWTSFSLALAVDEHPVVAVLAEPWSGRLAEARAGRGALLDGRPLTVPQRPTQLGAAADAASDPLRGAVVSTEWAAYRPFPGQSALLAALAQRYCTVRVMGSGALSLGGIAQGRGAGAVIGAFSPIDHLAAVLIVREAGGVVLDAQGRPSDFPAGGPVVAARDEQTARALLGLLPQD